DGYSDVIVGAYQYDNGESDEGAAFVYYGSGSGLSTAPDWMGESNQADAWFGNSVSTAGDVNGDGYSDVIVGAYFYDNGQTNEGATFVYYGNSDGIALVPQQMKTDVGSTPVQLLNATGTQDVRLKLIGRTPAGRGKVKLQWEIKELGQVMNGIGLGISSSWYDTDTNGIEIAEDITGLGEHKAYHWRVRLLYSPLNYDGSIYSRWLSIGPNGMNEKDFITTPLTGIREREINVNVFGLSIKNNISGGIVSISYSLNRDAYIRIKVYDVSGRVVKSIYKGRKAKGIYNDIWDTTDRGGNRVGSGIYFISLESEGGISTKKAIIVK
ncbi:FG-GAP repeat protein, partial [candidate division WOR-3 bacterium]|nr:FG-GAP repeat protein [candidate division WOR-3 bacterium]